MKTMPAGDPASDPIQGHPLRQCAVGAFTSQTVTARLLRGAVAFALLYAAVSLRLEHPGWALAAVALSFVAMGGSPVCWASGSKNFEWLAFVAMRGSPTIDGGTTQGAESPASSVPRTP